MNTTSRLLFASGVCAAALAAAPVANSAILNISVFDNGTLVGSALSTRGIAVLDITSDPEFSSISVRADGPLILPGADLSSVTLDTSASTGFTGTHVLTIDIFQTGVHVGPRTVTDSTFTVNNLIGRPGPTTLSDFINGTSSSLGTPLETATFPRGTTVGTVGPLDNTVGPLTADAQQYVITFNRGNQSANDTIQLTTSAIPEPSTYAMMLLGFVGLGYAGYRRAKATSARLAA